MQKNRKEAMKNNEKGSEPKNCKIQQKQPLRVGFKQNVRQKL